MGAFSFLIKDPNKAYLGSQLWLPKAHVNTRSIKASLEFEVRGDEGQEFLQLWEESPHHLAVPREYLLHKDYQTLSFPIVDMTPSDFPKAHFKSNLILDSKDPTSDRQHKAFAVFKQQDNGLLNLSCGVGKTCLALHKIAHEELNALIIVNQTTILDQWERSIRDFLEFEGGVGRIQGDPDKWDWRRPITIAMLHSLARHPDAVTPDMRRWFGVVVWDECFAAGTLVDGIPIEQRKIGDLVWSFDEWTETFSKQPIEKIFVSRPWALVSVFVNGWEIISTPGHPFWTARGWVPACLLTSTDMVLCSNHGQEYLCMRKAGSRQGDWKNVCGVQATPSRKIDEEIRAPLRLVQEDRHNLWAETHGAIPENEESLLLKRMYGSLGIERSLEAHEEDKSQTVQDPFQKDERAQSYAGSGGAGKTAHHTKSHAMEAPDPGWERETASVIATSTSFGSGMEDRGCGVDKRLQETRHVDSLQDRHREHHSEDSDRGGWTVPQLYPAQGAGPKERELSSWKRVEGVAFHQQTSDGTFGGRCPDGLVYNLQIRGTPTYQVSPANVVVHNCHHLSAPYFCVTATMFTGKRFGLTATANREDGTEVIYNYHLGEVFYKDLMQTVKPTIVFRQTPFSIPPEEYMENVMDARGNANISKLRSYVGTELQDRNEYQARDIQAALDSGRKVLALGHSVEQLKILNKMFQERGADCGLCTGQQKVVERWRALRDKRLIFGTHQLVMEAIDEDSLDTLYWLTPFGSQHPDGGKNALQQGMGRIQGYRFREGMRQPLVVIFDDIYIPHFHRMCNVLRKQLRRWPVDEGGPYPFRTLKPFEERT